MENRHFENFGLQTIVLTIKFHSTGTVTPKIISVANSLADLLIHEMNARR